MQNKEIMVAYKRENNLRELLTRADPYNINNNFDDNFRSKCMSCHKAIVVITGRAHCFHDCTYIYIYIYIYPHYCMNQSCKESAQYTCRAKYIYNYNSQIKLTQVSNY